MKNSFKVPPHYFETAQKDLLSHLLTESWSESSTIQPITTPIETKKSSLKLNKRLIFSSLIGLAAMVSIFLINIDGTSNLLLSDSDTLSIEERVQNIDFIYTTFSEDSELEYLEYEETDLSTFLY